METMRKYRVLPIELKGEQKLVVAMIDPNDLQIIDDLTQITGKEIVPWKVAEEELEAGLKRYLIDYQIPEIGEMSSGQNYYIQENAVGHLIDSILLKAVEQYASDIHFEPEQQGWRARFRIDGSLIELIKPKSVSFQAITSRLKILAGLDISKKREPQEGRFKQMINARDVDFRLVTMPSIHGEKVVIRVLDRGNISFSLDKLGFTAENLICLKEILQNPQGLLLITGPTGSGKTTTLYSILSELNVPEKSITTLEDPIEYLLNGVTQIPVNFEGGFDYATGLKSLLRQDPDIIMVGEIRDRETGQIALRAAITGHLVLATVHTTNASQAVSRLLDLGIEPYFIKSGLIGIVSQRLIRIKCKCNDGCVICNYSGYHGRTSIQEIIKISDNLSEMIKADFNETEFTKLAEKEGYVPLLKAGKKLCQKGMTDMGELSKVIYCP